MTDTAEGSLEADQMAGPFPIIAKEGNAYEIATCSPWYKPGISTQRP
jgi:hypothetical protein